MPPLPSPLDRRELLRRGAAGLAALGTAGLAGCGGGSSAAPAGPTTRRGHGQSTRAGAGAGTGGPAGGSDPAGSSTDGNDAAPPAPAARPATAADWSSLRRSLRGSLVRPHDRGYGVARQLYDPRFDGARPAAVAFCSSASDVQRCVAFARAHGLRPIPRGGGHSYAGYSTGPGLVVDVSRMSGMAVNRFARAGVTATVGAGTRLVDLYAGLAAHGVLVPGGSCPTVGIAGLALGGGIGVLSRRYGLTSDAIRSLRVVTADARLLTADAGRDADLYWGSRGGGGGNFGVVTSFTFDAHPIPGLAIFTLRWPWAAAREVLGAWLRWQRAAPDELWSNLQLASGGSAGLSVQSFGVLVGDATRLGRLVDQLAALAGSAPASRFVGDEAYLHAMLVGAGCAGLTVPQCHLATQDPAGTLSGSAFLAKSAYISRPMSSRGIDAAAGAVEDLAHSLPTFGGALIFDAYGGAINAVPAGATAFVHRNAICAIQSTVSLSSSAAPAEVAAGAGWLRHAAGALAPSSDGQAYQNYIDPTLRDWAHAYYATNLPRLMRVKRTYDPDDVFRFAQSIPLALP
jgi:FAD/FMN-containing dehydrogenase